MWRNILYRGDVYVISECESMIWGLFSYSLSSESFVVLLEYRFVFTPYLSIMYMHVWCPKLMWGWYIVVNGSLASETLFPATV